MVKLPFCQSRSRDSFNVTIAMKDLLPKQMFMEIFKVDSGSIYKSESHRLVARTKTSPNITMLSSQIPTWQLGLCSGWGDDLKFNRCLETISEDAELSLSTDAWQRIKICFVFFLFRKPTVRNAEMPKMPNSRTAARHRAKIAPSALMQQMLSWCLDVMLLRVYKIWQYMTCIMYILIMSYIVYCIHIYVYVYIMSMSVSMPISTSMSISMSMSKSCPYFQYNILLHSSSKLRTY